MSAPPRNARPWGFVPALYVLQGAPYFVVQAASNTFLAAMGASAEFVGRWSSDLTLPWMLKPLWSPLVDLFGTKRRWLLGAACLVLAAMVLVAWAAGRPDYVEATIAACVVLAFASATYDIACDGYYMLALGKREQEVFVGVRNACYRLGRIAITGGVVVLAGALQDAPGEHVLAHGLARGSAWGAAFAAGAGVYAVGLAWSALRLPRPAADGPAGAAPGSARDGLLQRIRAGARAYVARPRFVAVLAFILFYRAGESMLTPMLAPFLLQPAELGGMALGEKQVGFLYGTVGVVALLAGGIAGGWLIARIGLARCLLPMALAMNLPNVLYAWAAGARPEVGVLGAIVGFEQLGYGFGFAAFMVVLLQFSRASAFATTHYAISTGLMGLSAWLAGRWSGRIAEALGFERFFWLVSALGIASLATLICLPRLEEAPDGER